MEGNKLSLEDKKRYIEANAKNLSHEDIVDIKRLLIEKGHLDKMKPNAKDTRVDLHVLGDKDESIIGDLYGQIYHKLSKNK